MFEGEDIAFNGLEVCNYRHLQGVAKKLGLPSNVKKVHLIEMIRAKRYCTESDLKAIVDRIKMERKVNAQAKRKKLKRKTTRLQGTEVSSTSNSRSPPISQTPKRLSDVVFQYSPDGTIRKYHPGPRTLRTDTSILQPLNRPTDSDRVLRSFNSVKRPNYRIIEESNCVVSVVKAQNTLQERVQEIRQERALEIIQERVQERRPERTYQNVKVTVQKNRPMVNASVFMNRDRHLVPVSSSFNTSPKPAKRQHTLSGIYPLQPTEAPIYEYLPTVGFRRTDGRVAKINAIIKKQQSNALVPKKQTLLLKNHVQKPRSIIVSIEKKVERLSVDNNTNKRAKEHQSLYQFDSEIDQEVYSAIQSTIKPRATEPSINYPDIQIFSHRAPEPIYSISRTRDTNIPRNVYKNKQLDKTLQNKSLNYPIDEEHLDSSYNDWNVYDNGQSLRTDQKIASQDYITEPIPTNYNVRTTEPVLRDYQTDYQRFSQDSTNNNERTQYPNMQAQTDVLPNEEYQNMDANSDVTVYYHKKMRIQKRRDSELLPRINEAFSKFSDVQFSSVTQPLYVQVSEESERVPLAVQVTNTCMLESLYNFRNQFVTSTPVLQIATPLTHCTYSTKTVPTASTQPEAEFYDKSDAFEPAELRAPDTEYIPLVYEYLEPYDRDRTGFGCDEVLSSSTASVETTTSQELGANVTIPDMVEDALELISQDGDYMERIGMDVRVQCILCDWAGPKIILEYHIKKEHFNEIQQQDVKEWSVPLTLGELMSRQTWCSQLAQHGDTVYVLSAQCRDTDTIMVSLSMIPTGSDIPKRGRITVYNKISGKPYTFEGEIKVIPDSMPYEYGLECLTLDIASLDLIPNSANLQLINRQLVGVPVKAVVGQTKLKSVEMVVYVKLLD